MKVKFEGFKVYLVDGGTVDINANDYHNNDYDYVFWKRDGSDSGYVAVFPKEQVKYFRVAEFYAS